MCTVGGRIGWIVTRSGTARRPGIPGTTTMMTTVVLNGLIYTKCEMYLDDCIIFARGHDEFLERLERAFRRFRCFGLFLKVKKCRFGMKQIDYVGRQISSQGISMSKEKIESVLNFPKPKSLTAIRSFLGLANCFRCY